MTTTLIIQDKLAEQLSKIAENEHRSVEAVLHSALAQYQSPHKNNHATGALPTSNEAVTVSDKMFDDEVSVTVHKTVSNYYQKKFSRD